MNGSKVGYKPTNVRDGCRLSFADPRGRRRRIAIAASCGFRARAALQRYAENYGFKSSTTKTSAESPP
jgi:hypothetical protein